MDSRAHSIVPIALIVLAAWRNHQERLGNVSAFTVAGAIIVAGAVAGMLVRTRNNKGR